MHQDFDKNFLRPKYLSIWLGMLFLFIICYLPLTMRHKLAKILAKISYRYNHKRRNIIQVNLKRCFPNLSDNKITNLTQENLFYLALGMVEYGTILFSSKKRLKKMVAVENLDYLESLIKQKRGILLLVAHSPLMDFFAPALSDFAYGDYYKKLRNPVVNYFLLKSRHRFTPSLISREDGIGKIIAPLKNRKIFYYPADEDLGRAYSTFVPFFGENKSTLTTISRISKITKCLALPTIIFWDKRTKKYTVKFGTAFENYPSDSPEKDARQLNHQLEQLITPNLTQYMWSFKLFRTRIKDGEDVYYEK